MSEFSPNVDFKKENVKSVAGFTDNVADTNLRLREKSMSTAGNLKEIAKSEFKVKADGVLSEEEQDDQSPYTEQEMNAFSVEDKKKFLTELQNTAKEQNSFKKLENQKNKKEGKAFELALEKRKIEEELKAKFKEFEAKKEAIENQREVKIARTEARYQRSETRLREGTSKERHYLTNEIRNNSAVSEFSENSQKLKDLESYLGFQRTDEIQQGLIAKRDEAKVNPDVNELMQKIAELPAKLEEQIQARKQGLINRLGIIEKNTKEELNQLKGLTLTEVNEIKQRLSQVEQEQAKVEQEFDDLEMQIADKQRMQDSVDILKDDLREFSFKDAKKVTADLEKRSANTVSLENLSDSEELNKEQLGGIIERAQKILTSLIEVGDASTKANENAYLEQEAVLDDEKTKLLGEKEQTHKDLIGELSKPFADALKKAKEIPDAELEEGANAIEAFSKLNLKALGEEQEKAEKKIDKSTDALNKFTAKVEKRFAKLTAKLDRSRVNANNEVYNLLNDKYKDTSEVKKMAQEFQNTDFDQMVQAGSLLKRVFSKIFASRQA
ncbi:hypothetical protein KKI22_00900 [Patescibacteria group bacterium]|nr:hypothetical protein [Patescibacteria group bacterium]